MDEPRTPETTRTKPAAGAGRARRIRPTPAAAAYVLVVGAVAATGLATASPATFLLAALLALPSSIPAVLGYYLVFGLLALLPGADPSHSGGSGSCSPGGGCRVSSTGDPAVWFTLTTDVVAVLALIAAAVLNVVVLRSVLAARRARRQDPRHGRPDGSAAQR